MRRRTRTRTRTGDYCQRMGLLVKRDGTHKSDIDIGIRAKKDPRGSILLLSREVRRHPLLKRRLAAGGGAAPQLRAAKNRMCFCWLLRDSAGGVDALDRAWTSIDRQLGPERRGYWLWMRFSASDPWSSYCQRPVRPDRLHGLILHGDWAFAPPSEKMGPTPSMRGGEAGPIPTSLPPTAEIRIEFGWAKGLEVPSRRSRGRGVGRVARRAGLGK